MDSEIGVYAGSPDSYIKFCKLFDPIINEYHGSRKLLEDRYMPPDASKLNTPTFPKEDVAMFV